jgi:hypothetical protein
MGSGVRALGSLVVLVVASGAHPGTEQRGRRGPTLPLTTHHVSLTLVDVLLLVPRAQRLMSDPRLIGDLLQPPVAAAIQLDRLALELRRIAPPAPVA